MKPPLQTLLIAILMKVNYIDDWSSFCMLYPHANYTSFFRSLAKVVNVHLSNRVTLQNFQSLEWFLQPASIFQDVESSRYSMLIFPQHRRQQACPLVHRHKIIIPSKTARRLPIWNFRLERRHRVDKEVSGVQHGETLAIFLWQ